MSVRNAAAPTANGLADVITAGRGTRWLKNALKPYPAPAGRLAASALTCSHSHSRIPLPRRRACRPGSPSLIALQAADLCVALQRSLAATRVLANRHCCYSLSASWPPADTGPPISPARNQPIRCACGRAGWGLVMHRSIWRPPPMPVMLPHRWAGRLVRRLW